MRFATEITLSGPWRHPAQMLADQAYDGHASVHDDSTATALGLAGAPIEGPTHFSQFDPLATTVWGREWFERGCLSAHFRTMVIEGEAVQASLTIGGDDPARETKEIVAVGQSRRTESYWTRTTLTDVERGTTTAEVLLHSGVFKESYPGYPPDRLAG